MVIDGAVDVASHAGYLRIGFVDEPAVAMAIVTSYLPSGRSFSESRSVCITNWSPTAVTGSPVASINMPEATMATWPCGSLRMPKIAQRHRR